MEKHTSFFQMFKQAMKLPSMSWTFTSSVVAVLLLIPYTIFFMINQLITQPTVVHLTVSIVQLTTKSQIDPEFRQLLLQAIKDDIKSLIFLELVPVVINLFVSLLRIIGISGAAFAVYHGRNFCFSRWVARVKSSWKAVLVTVLYTNLLGFGEEEVLHILLIISLFFFESFVFARVLILLGLLLLMRLSLTSSMGFMAAASEGEMENCGGLVALPLGAMVIKQRIRQGWWYDG